MSIKSEVSLANVKFVFSVFEMKLFVVALFAFLAVSASADDYDDIDWSQVVPVTELPGFWAGRDLGPAFYPNDKTRSGRIVGGSVVVPHSHPYQAGLLIAWGGGGTGLCGATIIGFRTILTAAHCSVGSSSTLVILGAHQLQGNEATQHRQTVQSGAYRIHAGYNSGNLNNDIAILILPANAPANAHIGHANLAPANAPDFNGDWATMSGWGGIDGGGTSTHLRSTQNNVISNAACAAVFGGIIIHSTICTSGAGGRQTCGGDSGGPLTVVFQGARTQIGVTSFVSGNGCTAGHPAGFARVSA